MSLAIFIVCCIACIANLLDSFSAKTDKTKLISCTFALLFAIAAALIAGGILR